MYSNVSRGNMLARYKQERSNKGVRDNKDAKEVRGNKEIRSTKDAKEARGRKDIKEAGQSNNSGKRTKSKTQTSSLTGKSKVAKGEPEQKSDTKDKPKKSNKKLKEKWEGKSKDAKIADSAEASTSAAPCKEDEPAKDVTSESVNKPFVFHRETLNLSDRPIRAAAATAQAISEAQQEFLDTEPPPEYKRNKHGVIEVLVDKPIKTRRYCKRPKSSNVGDTAVDGEEKTPGSKFSEETLLQNVDDLIESFKDQYKAMVESMQTPVFLKCVEKQLKKEKHRQRKFTEKLFY